MMIGYDSNAGFIAYKTHKALKFHFTGNYDFFKYQGKMKNNQDAFSKRRDKAIFMRIERKHKNDLIEYLVSNIVIDPNMMPFQIASQEGEDNFLEWKRRNESLRYIVTNEFNFIHDFITLHDLEFNSIFKVSGADHPIIFKFFLGKKLSIETMSILNDILNFVDVWNNAKEVFWNDSLKIIKKYTPFIAFDRSVYKTIAKNIFIN